MSSFVIRIHERVYWMMNVGLSPSSSRSLVCVCIAAFPRRCHHQIWNNMRSLVTFLQLGEFVYTFDLLALFLLSWKHKHTWRHTHTYISEGTTVHSLSKFLFYILCAWHSGYAGCASDHRFFSRVYIGIGIDRWCFTQWTVCCCCCLYYLST